MAKAPKVDLAPPSDEAIAAQIAADSAAKPKVLKKGYFVRNLTQEVLEYEVGGDTVRIKPGVNEVVSLPGDGLEHAQVGGTFLRGCSAAHVWRHAQALGKKVEITQTIEDGA